VDKLQKHDSKSKRKIVIVEDIFDPLKTQSEYQRQSMQGHTDFGATANFVGTMRDFNEGDDVLSMVLEHYPAMTDKQLNQIVDEACEKWPIQNTLVVHRIGEIFPAEAIVLVAVWSAHRNAAFDACRFIMEALKHKAPFWKQESLTTGSRRWVEENTQG
jgi:molybdopterin synthase catalytic subunit